MKRFLNLFRREKLSRDIDDELSFHVAERVERLIAEGATPEEAARQARMQFGGLALYKEDTWTTDLVGWIESLLADLRYAVRGFARSPGFTAVAILSLALGIGANTAIFSLIDAVMLRALPVSHPEALMLLTTSRKTGQFIDEHSFSNPLWEQVRDHQDVFSGALAWGSNRFDLAAGGEARNVNGDFVSGGYFTTLGVGATLGRTLVPADDHRGCAAIAVLGHDFWVREYGGDAGVIGKNISFESHPFQIVGVSQPGFTGLNVGRSVDAFVPLCTEAVVRGEHSALDRPSSWWLRVMARRMANVSEAQMRARLATLSPGIFAATVPSHQSVEAQDEYRKRVISAEPGPNGLSNLSDTVSSSLWVLMAAVALVLLIACANVANLMLARAAARQREMAVRMAMGAGRVRLIRQTLTESLLLSLAGAALGLGIAQWGSRVLTAMISTPGNPVWLDLALHTRMLLFTTAVAGATAVLFGLLPALQSARVAPMIAMKAAGRGLTGEISRLRLGKMLVVAQVALSMVLVAGAGLMLGTFRNLTTMDPGFRTDRVLVVTADLTRGNFSKERQAVLWHEILVQMRTIPGVQSASGSDLTPISRSAWNEGVRVEDQALRIGDNADVYFNAVSEGYFDTLGMTLLAGRDIQASDTAGAPGVAVISESMARLCFGRTSPLGRVFRVANGDSYTTPRTIVGVVRDAKYGELREDPRATAYVPLAQTEEIFPSFELHTAGPPASLIPSVKQAVAAVSPKVTIEIRPFAVQVAASLSQERMLAMLCSFFGGLALLLAAIGLYGVLSYNVARRRNEIGIRMALGADRARVLRLVIGEAGWLAFIGLGLGIAGTLAATQLLDAFVYGMRTHDPRTLAAAVVVLAAVAGVAAYLPARRASLVDPMTALRDE